MTDFNSRLSSLGGGLKFGGYLATGAAMSKWAEELKAELKRELEEQGHVATGALLNSISFEFKQDVGKNIKVDIKALARGEDLNVYQNPKSKSVTSFANSVGKIVRWLNAKGIKRIQVEGKKEVDLKYKIKYSKLYEGTPTRGAFEYSRNGRRIGWIDIPYFKKHKEIDSKILPAIEDDVIFILDRIFRKWAARDENIKYIP